MAFGIILFFPNKTVRVSIDIVEKYTTALGGHRQEKEKKKMQPKLSRLHLGYRYGIVQILPFFQLE
jgi:hypothetical protein